MKIVLDTNCLLVILPKFSKYRLVFDKIKDGSITIAVTTEILNEYEELLSSFYSVGVADNVLRLFMELENTQLITIYYKWNLITKDPDDNKFIDCAIASETDYIVTNDAHFKILQTQTFPYLKTIKLEEFLTLIKE